MGSLNTLFFFLHARQVMKHIEQKHPFNHHLQISHLPIFFMVKQDKVAVRGQKKKGQTKRNVGGQE